MLYTMRLTTILVAVFAFCLAGFAQDELTQYQTWMKAAAKGNGGARKAIAAKDVAAASAAAKDTAAAFDSIATFWKSKGKDDAVKFAETARDAAQATAAATTSEDQQAALSKIGANCMGCHMAYREGNTSAFKGL
jgi:cytochrome c556